MSKAYTAGFLDKCAEFGVDGRQLVKESQLGKVVGYFDRLAGGNVGTLREAISAAKAQRGSIFDMLKAVRASGAPGFQESVAAMRPQLAALRAARMSAERELAKELKEVWKTRGYTLAGLGGVGAVYGLGENIKREPYEKNWFRHWTDNIT